MIDPMSKIERLVLRQLKVGVQHEIDLGFVEDSISVDATIDEFTRRMVVSLRAHVLAERLPPKSIERSTRVEFEVPASWWQHFKADHALRWWLRGLVRRRPVVTETLGRTAHWSVSLERYRTYPKAQSLPATSYWSDSVEVHMFTDERVRWSD